MKMTTKITNDNNQMKIMTMLTMLTCVGGNLSRCATVALFVASRAPAGASSPDVDGNDDDDDGDDDDDDDGDDGNKQKETRKLPQMCIPRIIIHLCKKLAKDRQLRPIEINCGTSNV